MAIWHKQTSETDVAFAAFQSYLALSHNERSIRQAYVEHRKLFPKKVGLGKGKKTALIVHAPRQWLEYSAKHDWVERAGAYDAHMFIIQQSARERALVKSSGEHAKQMLGLSKQVIAKVEEMLKLPLVRQRIDKDGQTIIIEPIRFTMGDVGFLLATVDRISRLALGMDTEQTSIKLDVSVFTDEQLERLAAGEELQNVITVS